MREPEVWLALATCAAVAWMALEWWWGLRRLPELRRLPPVDAARPLPRVSIIVPARNEERHVEQALRSLLVQDYPHLEVIAVNDRSEDGTGRVLRDVAAHDPRVRVLDVVRLPPGWLGKTHALHSGAESATGALLLFVDADVVMEPTALSRAIGHLMRQDADHLTIMPHLAVERPGLQVLINGFVLMFTSYYRPWRVAHPHSRQSLGIGAFNLVSAAAYRGCGTHARIAMRPDDDMKLGKLLKQAGYRTLVVRGGQLVWLRWYDTAEEFVHGLTKSAFAGMDYRLWRVAAVLALQALVHWWPIVALWSTRHIAWQLNAATVGLQLGTAVLQARQLGFRWWVGLGFPFASLAVAYVLVRSATLTLLTAGVTWRGTHYPLEQLRANQV